MVYVFRIRFNKRDIISTLGYKHLERSSYIILTYFHIIVNVLSLKLNFVIFLSISTFFLKVLTLFCIEEEETC